MRMHSKLLCVLIPVFVGVAVLDGVLTYRTVKKQTLDDIRRQAGDIRAMLMATRRVYHHQFIESGLPVTDQTVGFLPAHALSRIAADFGDWTESGVTFNNVSDQARNADNAADALELEAMAYFRDHPEIEERFVPAALENGDPIYHYTRPIWVEEYCMTCHGKQAEAPKSIRETYAASYDYEVGDLRGVMSIKLPGSALWERASAAFWQSLAITGGGYFLIFVLVYWLLVQNSVRRLQILEQGSEALARGDYTWRSGMGGTDEIAKVALTFESMAGRVAEREGLLRTGEDRLNEAQSIAGIGSFDYDMQSEKVWWSRELYQIHGQTQGVYIPSRDAFENLVLEEDRTTYLGIVDECLRTGAAIDAQYRIRTADGAIRLMRTIGEATRAEDGTIIGMRGTVRDVTDWEQAQDDLTQSATLMRNILDSSPDFIFAKDLELRTLICNAAFASAVGKTPLEMIGRTDLENGWSESVVNGCVKHGTRGALVDDLEALRGTPIHHVHDVCILEGVKRIFDTHKLPLKDHHGEIIGILGVARDITQRKENEAELAKLSAAVINSPVSIVVTDHHGIIEYVNPKYVSMTGFSEQELIGKKASIFASDQTNRETYDEMWSALSDGDEWKGILCNRHKNGEIYWEQASISSLCDDAGRITHFVAVREDITEILKANEALEAQAESERLLMRELDHRVRNNLSSLIALIDISRKGALDTEDFADSIRDRAQTIATVHSALSKAKWQGVKLQTLIRSLTDGQLGARIELAGPDVMVPPVQAQAIGLVVNELAINCGKYGAMRRSSGRVELRWDAESNADGSMEMVLHWQEFDGPPIIADVELGTGLKLIQGLVGSELAGEVEFGFEPRGVSHRIVIRLRESGTAQYTADAVGSGIDAQAVFGLFGS